MNAPDALLVYCRAGFEPEASQECQEAGRALGWQLAPLKIGSQSGFVVLGVDRPLDATQLRRWDSRELTFCRQVVWTRSTVVALGQRDRVTPIAAAMAAWRPFAGGFSDVWVEYPDTNEGKAQSSLSRAIEPRIVESLRTLGAMREAAPALGGGWRAHAFLASKSEAWVGLTAPSLSVPWRLGIPRLRMPGDAPSRSTQKLAEAFLFFLAGHVEEFVKAGMRAVDLGAAPGGWTWQMIHRGLHVTAVDNGDLKGELCDNALVRHCKQDGFHFRPKRPVEWLLCDMVEQPVRIAALVADWVATETAQHAIFNLKLPMKKRLAELQRCQAVIAARMDDSGAHYHLQFRHLFHDREEVTGFLTRHGKRLQRLKSSSVS